MNPGPAPKRRRVDTPHDAAGETSTYTLIHRRDEDMRLSLQDLHSSLDRYGDVLVCAHGECSTEEFPCVSALLASASRPLGAMLFGHLAATEPAPAGASDSRRRLHLRMTEPDHFKHLLLYIHGQDIPLEVEEAFQMHHVADFYEVLGLRDACCRFLLESLRPHNCCHLLSRSSEVHCEPLEQRCLDMLTLDFIAVVEHDPEFPSLSAPCLQALLSRDELVCADEFEVFDAIVTWYCRSPSAEKHEAVPQLLPLVRWPLLREERRADVFVRAAKLRPPRESLGASSTDGAAADGGRRRPLSSLAARAATPASQLSLVGSSVSLAESEYDEEQLDTFDEDDAAADAANMAADMAADGAVADAALDNPPAAAAHAAGKEHKEAGASPWDEGDTEATQLVRELWPEPMAPEQEDPSSSVPRQYFWGQLTSRNPPPPAGQPAPVGGDGERVYQLQSTKEYMVGRSRKSDIRVGHQAPMPYISSQHFRLFHAIKWPEVDGVNDPRAEEEAKMPVLEAWIEDLSQNGTYINGTQIGKNKSQVLNAGDRIEMVFPLGRQPPQNPSSFPIFTFNPHQPPPAAVASPPVSSTAANSGTPRAVPVAAVGEADS